MNVRHCLWTLLALAAGCGGTPVVGQVHTAAEFELRDGTRYRLAGIESPARSEPQFEACRLMAAKLLLDRPVKLVLDPADTARPPAAMVYTPIQVGREARYLFVNHELALFGWARATPAPRGTKLAEHYQGLQQAQAQARREGLGIWGR